MMIGSQHPTGTASLPTSDVDVDVDVDFDIGSTQNLWLLEIGDGSGHLNLRPRVIDIGDYEYGAQNKLFCHHRGENSRISKYVLLCAIYSVKVWRFGGYDQNPKISLNNAWLLGYTDATTPRVVGRYPQWKARKKENLVSCPKKMKLDKNVAVLTCNQGELISQIAIMESKIKYFISIGEKILEIQNMWFCVPFTLWRFRILNFMIQT